MQKGESYVRNSAGPLSDVLSPAAHACHCPRAMIPDTRTALRVLMLATLLALPRRAATDESSGIEVEELADIAAPEGSSDGVEDSNRRERRQGARAAELLNPTPVDPYQPRYLGFPIVGYTPDTSLAFAVLGMVQFRTASTSPRGAPSTASAAASYTLRNQWLVQIEPNLRFRDDHVRVGASFMVQDWAADYFGIGDRAAFGDREEYVPRRLGVSVEALGALDRDARLHVGGLVRAVWVDVREIRQDGLLWTERPVGVGGGYVTGVGAIVSWDDTDSSFFPTSGTRATASLTGYERFLGSDFGYVRGELDGRGYLSPGRRPHILAARATLDTHAGEVPFYDLARLGGANQMRGMTTGRFRDMNAWVTQLEYRTPFVWRIGFVSFAALGDVFGRYSAEELDDPKWTAGGGVRLRIDDVSGINVRLDYGVSAEQFQNVYLSITEAF